jgi:PAS domain S-box-containing protein
MDDAFDPRRSFTSDRVYHHHFGCNVATSRGMRAGGLAMSNQSAPEPSGVGALFGGERRVLELIATGAPLESVLDELCRLIDETSGLRSSVFLLDNTRQYLNFVSGPHLPDVWRSAVASFPVTVTACGAAVTRREQTITSNIAKDPLYAGFAEAAQQADIRAVWSTPFFSKYDSPLGTFAVYSSEPGPPSEGNLNLVTRATHLASIAVEHQLTEQKLRDSEHLVRLVLDALPVGVLVTDTSGNAILSNPASRRIWGRIIDGGPERYARSQGWRHDTGETIQPHEWASWRALVNGDTTINEQLDIEAFDGTRKVIHNSAVPIRDHRQAIVGAVVINEDITAQKAAERDLQSSMQQMQMLATRLMNAQDDERRRIAQMLHETTAQNLAALRMLLARLTRTSAELADADRALLAESVQLADHSISEVRTLAYLLHPPYLDEAGLLSALRWYARGFADRSGIHVELDLPDAIERLSQDVERTLFRVVQEALINVHRHADSPTARIGLRVTVDQLTLEIEDRGRGMAPEFAIGVGIAGMRERLKPIGGRLEIESSGHGVVVRAIVPVATSGE